MFERLHRQMTFYCMMITSVILVAMTMICLFISENGIKSRGYASFVDHQAAVISYLESQTQISGSWIRQTEARSHIKMDIRDNGTSLLSLKLKEDYMDLADDFQRARTIAEAEFGLGGIYFQKERSISGSCSFQMKGQKGNDYIAGISLIPKGENLLEAVLLYPMKDMEKEIFHQRFLFALVDLAAIGLLGIFSWLFTAWIIHPIRDNRERQIRFIASASHELRSPLAVILSSLSAAKAADPAQAEHFLDTVQAEGKRMARLVDDMLILANADNQRWSVRPECMEPEMLILKAYETYECVAKKRGFSLTVTLPKEDCPVVLLDSERIMQVLSILLDNAMTYTPAPGKISLSLSCERKGCRITVTDSGPGVPDEEKQAIFERFYRADRARTDRSHFGLGLCIAAEIVKLHRGDIYVEDAPGGGAVFVVRLPLALDLRIPSE